MNTEKPLSSHTAERTLYQVQVRSSSSRLGILNGKLIKEDWQSAPLPPARYMLTDHTDTRAELDDGLFPFALAMTHCWGILATEHADLFDVRLVPHVVKTSYASFPQEPLLELDRNPE